MKESKCFPDYKRGIIALFRANKMPKKGCSQLLFSEDCNPPGRVLQNLGWHYPQFSGSATLSFAQPLTKGFRSCWGLRTG
jgi:hypothetical protein